MEVLDALYKFYKQFKGRKGVFGYSALSRPLYYFDIKKTERPLVIVQCSIHAREYITTAFCLKEIADFEKKGKFGRAVFIPCLNPDGVDIAERIDPLYKANANGVDLNVNFPARWGTGVKNVRKSGSENYVGSRPFSEPETIAIKNLTLRLRPDATISYHTKGEEIYYSFYQECEREKRDLHLAKLLSEHTGYKIGSALGSCGGYKDWCIEELKIPAFTIEAGKEKTAHPLKSKGALRDIVKKNKGITRRLIGGLKDYERKIYENRDKRGEKGKG